MSLTLNNVSEVKCHIVHRGIRGEEEHHSKRSSRTFDIDRLFAAVASRDVRQLDSLHQYLQQSMKKLSDSLCERHTFPVMRQSRQTANLCADQTLTCGPTRRSVLR